jgi:gamma-glutamylcyclotransferase (GGCT)/AIG2-like uncharacterized protein YtfP
MKKLMELNLKRLYENIENGKLLFVYGTMMEGGENHPVIQDGAELLGDVKTKNKYHLYLLPPDSPAIEKGTDKVVGQLFKVSVQTLAKADKFEHPYTRRPIELEDGRRVFAYFPPVKHEKVT